MQKGSLPSATRAKQKVHFSTTFRWCASPEPVACFGASQLNWRTPVYGQAIEAELYWLRGALTWGKDGAGGAAAAEADLLKALDAAEKQQALTWELRAAMDLARLWRQTGRGQAARELLAGIYGRFTEGFATPDLREAGALLADLRS